MAVVNRAKQTVAKQCGQKSSGKKSSDQKQQGGGGQTRLGEEALVHGAREVAPELLGQAVHDLPALPLFDHFFDQYLIFFLPGFDQFLFARFCRLIISFTLLFTSFDLEDTAYLHGHLPQDSFDI